MSDSTDTLAPSGLPLESYIYRPQAASRYDEIQLRIFRDRYAVGGEQYPHQAWDRVARAVAEAEPEVTRAYWFRQFYELLNDFRYVPGGRILYAMGNPAGVTAMNCYVLPSPEDSREGLFRDTAYEWAEIQSRGGGVGINVSTLRPNGFPVRGVNGTSSGPVTWAELLSMVSKIIIQGGSRRGAAMIMLNDDHPDIFEFIHAKETPGVLEGANLSVCISDAFMSALAAGGDWDLRWDGEVVRTIKAAQLWDEICAAAWRSGEPGIYFLDRANKQANSGYFEKLIGTNPCGEQPLGPYGACLLGAFNLVKFVGVDAGVATFDYAGLASAVETAVRFNDNIIDLSLYPLDACAESQQRIRRMGIGVMGLADVLIMLGLRYGSPEAVKFTEGVFKRLRDTAYGASVELAAGRGAFPEYDLFYTEQPFVAALPRYVHEAIEENGIRNCYLLSQAPTGTIALLAGVNSGIEPYFDFATLRKDRTGTYDVIQQDYAALYASPDRPDYLVIANDVTPEEHVAMQAAVQRYVDSSVSKTVNAPYEYTVEEVRRLYRLAYAQGLKSVTVYRDRSREDQVLWHKSDEVGEAPLPATSARAPEATVVGETTLLTSPSRKRLPDTRDALTHKFTVGGQEGYVTVGIYPDGTPGEVFINISKTGSTLKGLVDWGATMFSMALQYGAPLEDLTAKMVNTKFEPFGFTSNPQVRQATSVLDYIGRWLSHQFTDEPTERSSPGYVDLTGALATMGVQQAPLNIFKGVITESGDFCPECGIIMRPSEGCVMCPQCFFTKCG